MRRAAPTLALLADDRPTNRAILVRQVHALGYAAESAIDGLEALAMWKSGRFGFLVTDVNMPGLDGYELARSIRGLEASAGAKRFPILACTANVMACELEVCPAAGLDDYTARPVGLREPAPWLVPTPWAVFAAAWRKRLPSETGQPWI